LSLLADVLDAHGGAERWRQASSVSLELSSGGFAFTSKGQGNALRRLRARVSTTGQHVHLDTPAWTHSFHGSIPAPSGIRWSDQDITAFAAVALWTYASLPFVLPELDVTEQHNRLIVDFPRRIRTHSPRQVLHVGDDGLIFRHDYTALDFGRWAHASQLLSDYRRFDGFNVATRRRVRPRYWPHRPELVWIDVHTMTVTPLDQPSTAR
jgi:hypothetical protein